MICILFFSQSIFKNFVMSSVESNAIDFPPDYDDHVLALEGISLMLNNGFKESELLFGKFKHNSPLMSAGSSFVSFMQGLMTFEDEKLESAINSLKATQKLCNASEDDLIDNLKNKFRKKTVRKKRLSVEAILQRKIIIADCYLYLSLIHFIKQEITGFIKGGWNLRKAWKIYEKAYEQIVELLKARNVTYATPSNHVGFVNNDAETNGSSNPTSPEHLSSSGSALSSNDGDDVIDNSELSKAVKDSDLISIDTNALVRLYGAVCFGYGAFNLCVSLVPPHLLRIVNMMGFSGDRLTGVHCLEVASQSDDMKAPLAMLSLLWFHTVVRPFFAVDGDCMNAGLPDAEKLLETNEKKYPTSSLVLFFKGRILRCRRDITGALEALQSSYDLASEQRELQLLCAYEIGWCCIMDMKWKRAFENISRVKEESKWSVCYYTYLVALLHGALKDYESCRKTMIEVPKLMKRKNNQLEIYVTRKARTFQKIPPTHEHIMTLVLEVLYLWSSFPHCTPDSLQKMLDICNEVSNPCLNGMKQLLLGALHKSLKNDQEAKECFRNAIQISERDLEDGHIAPFACYELAVLMIASKDSKQTGINLLQQCKENFSGYDFENRLQMRIHATELRLKESES